MSKVKLGWGQSVTGEMLHISSVFNGKKCACVCPDCGIELIARHCKYKADHFAHAVECECSGESALHRAAKQVLEKAAATGDQLSLPSIFGNVYLNDCCEQTHTQEWSIKDPIMRISYAKQEVSFLDKSLIADVVVIDAKQVSIAVEIHVTNKKSEEERSKYILLNQEVVEIDLSELEWDSDEKTVRDAVLEKSPREWLFCSRKEPIIERAKKELEENVDRINRRYLLEFDDAVSNFKGSVGRLATLPWSCLARTEERENVYGEVISETVYVTPIVTLITADWEKSKGVWRTAGLVNDKTEVDVLFLLRGFVDANCKSKQPSLIIWFDPTEGSFLLEWMNIEHWMRELSSRAIKKIHHMLEETTKNKNKGDEFSQYFCSLTDQEKMNYLANKLSITSPKIWAKVAPPWNVSRPVWKTLVWLYKLKPHQGSKLNVKHASSDAWLRGMMGWEDSQKLESQRSKDAWFWLKELEQVGFVKHVGKQWFFISENLPNDFAPWQKVSSLESDK